MMKVLYLGSAFGILSLHLYLLPYILPSLSLAYESLMKARCRGVALFGPDTLA